MAEARPPTSFEVAFLQRGVRIVLVCDHGETRCILPRRYLDDVTLRRVCRAMGQAHRRTVACSCADPDPLDRGAVCAAAVLA